MDTNLLNTYVLKALDAYPYDLEEVVENLNYALSYQNDNVHALFLMGQLQAEQFGDYEKAKQYYAEALANKMEFFKIYPKYITVLIWNEDFNEAQELVDFAFNLKGICKGELWMLQGQLFENKHQFNKALNAFKKSQLHTYNIEFMSVVESEISRVKKKVKSNDDKPNKKAKKEIKSKKSKK